ncbi:MAG: TraB/GumN family protein [Sarcina sp.]
MKKNILIGLSVGVISILAIFKGCSSTQETIQVAKEPTKGFLWEATKDNKTVYLAGTMHPAPKDINYFNDSINEIISKTDAIAIELDTTSLKTMDEVKKIQTENYFLKKGELKDLLTEDEFKKLEKILKDFGLKYSKVKTYSPDALLTGIEKIQINNLGYIGESIDLKLVQIYKEKKREIIELETASDQFNPVHEINTIKTLKEFIENYDTLNYQKESGDLINNTFKAYEVGNKIFANEYIETVKKESSDYYNKLIVNRNKNMVTKIDKLVQENKNIMVAVGYFHLFGEESILAMLEEKGYKITNIES